MKCVGGSCLKLIELLLAIEIKKFNAEFLRVRIVLVTEFNFCLLQNDY